MSCSEPLSSVAYLYDGTPEGLLSAVFDAYAFRERPDDILDSRRCQLRLGQSVRVIDTSEEKAVRVRRAVRRTCGPDAFDALLHASLSDDARAAGAVYRFVRFAMDDYRHRPAASRGPILGQLACSAVGDVAALARSVRNEAHRMKQFLRFEQKETGLWVGECNPKANVVPLVMPHFAGRFNTQPFAIVDEDHQIAGVSQDGRWRLVRALPAAQLGPHGSEEAMQRAWCAYYDSASIDERYHPELRRQFMPMRLWANITEMSRPWQVADRSRSLSAGRGRPDAALPEGTDGRGGSPARGAGEPLDAALPQPGAFRLSSAL